MSSHSSFTDCPLSELQMAGPPPDDIFPKCQQDQDTVTSITIPNGVINVTCYIGRQFVSVASHVCDEGYQPNVTSSVRVCRDNGLWSGTTIICGEGLTCSLAFPLLPLYILNVVRCIMCLWESVSLLILPLDHIHTLILWVCV